MYNSVYSRKTFILNYFAKYPNVILILAGVIIGIGGGYGAILFRHLISFFQSLFYGASCSFSLHTDEQVVNMLENASTLQVLLIPALGGLLVGLIVYFFAPEAKGHGVPEVMESVALKGGKIRKRVVLIKALASSICIASGGAVGREGPIVQIGSSWGSALGQFFKLKKDDLRTMVGCGAAAGIAATFSAPIAAVFFAAEVILGSFKIRTVTPIIIASAIATEISYIHLGDTPSFLVPAYTLASVYEIPLYMVLGIFAALVGLMFMVVLYASEDFFDNFTRIPSFIKPLIGGLILGLIGLFCIQVYGVGYGTMSKALHGNLTFYVLMLLLFTKCAATSITLGSGGSGGVFAPSLFLGAMAGGIFGYFVNWAFPSVTADPGAYSLVGMGGVVAATTHAPISAILILFEMTHNYKIILPLMLCCVISNVVVCYLKKESIYTMKLIRRGVTLDEAPEKKVLSSIPVESIVHTKYEIIAEDMPFDEFVQKASKSKHFTFPVVTKEGILCGLISHQNLENYESNDFIKKSMIARDLVDSNFISLTPEHTLLDALIIQGEQSLDKIPIVSNEKNGKLVGMLSRDDLMQAYYKALVSNEEKSAFPKNYPVPIGETFSPLTHLHDIVIEDVKGQNKEAVIEELLTIMKQKNLLGNYEIDEVKTSVLRREQLASTVIEEGFAMPHARLERLDKLVAAFAHSNKGIDFGSERGPVYSILLFLCPFSQPNLHIQFVGGISKILGQKDAVKYLNQSATKEQIIQIFQTHTVQ